MNRREFTASLLSGASALAAPSIVLGQTVYNLKLGHFISPQHIMSVYLQKWVDELKEKSNGRLNITIFPANTMGPVQNYADYARTGGYMWFLHGATPGRFPLTECNPASVYGRQRRDWHEGTTIRKFSYWSWNIRAEDLAFVTHQPGGLYTASNLCAPSMTSKVCAFGRLRSRLRASSRHSVGFLLACHRRHRRCTAEKLLMAVSSTTAARTLRSAPAAAKYTTEMYSYVRVSAL